MSDLTIPPELGPGPPSPQRERMRWRITWQLAFPRPMMLVFLAAAVAALTGVGDGVALEAFELAAQASPVLVLALLLQRREIYLAFREEEEHLGRDAWELMWDGAAAQTRQAMLLFVIVEGAALIAVAADKPTAFLWLCIILGLWGQVVGLASSHEGTVRMDARRFARRLDRED